MTLCEYGLGYGDFKSLYDFLSCQLEGDVSIDEHENLVIETDTGEIPDVIREGLVFLRSLRRFGDSVPDVIERIKPHVRVCAQCRGRYMTFLGYEWPRAVFMVENYGRMGMNIDSDYVSPDYLELDAKN